MQQTWHHTTNSYVQIRFVLEHPDTSAPTANVDKSGWYIDDLRLGDEYVQSGELTINNVQPPVSYDDKQPNGYGVLFLDSFVPGESTLTVDVLDAVSGQVITADGAPLSGLVGPAIRLWGVDVDNHPFISLKLNFSSGASRVSTPYLYGYNIGSSFLVSFNDRDNYRGLNISKKVIGRFKIPIANLLSSSSNPLISLANSINQSTESRYLNCLSAILG